jgi:hypothetical protein
MERTAMGTGTRQNGACIAPARASGRPGAMQDHAFEISDATGISEKRIVIMWDASLLGLTVL